MWLQLREEIWDLVNYYEHDTSIPIGAVLQALAKVTPHRYDCDDKYHEHTIPACCSKTCRMCKFGLEML